MIFDAYINTQLRPAMITAGQRAEAYAERILARLDMLVEATQAPEFAEYHPRQAFTLTAGTAQDLRQIPAGEMWELEYVSCAGAATITVNEGGDLFVYAKQFTVADAQFGIGLMFGGGAAPTIISAGNATPIPVVLQFKRRHILPARLSNAAGLMHGSDRQTPVNGDPHGGTDIMGRHDAHFEQGRNIIGERA
jgi:hypothetical protein